VIAESEAIGVLALQGDFERHRQALAASGLASREVRRPGELGSVSGLVLPGGESTTMQAISDFAASGRPILATCAGLILAAKRVDNPRQESLGLLDVDVVRNAYGRQLDSFVGAARLADGGELEAVYIRAPKITRSGEAVEVLARQGEDPVLVRQGNLWGATFHPELTPGSPVHGRVFADAAAGCRV
jgi:5'-phosphate synthase pdxT subunit